MNIKLLILLLISATKFAVAPSIAVLGFKYNFFQSVIITSAGGIIGVLFFTSLSKEIINLWKHFVATSNIYKYIGNIFFKIFKKNIKKRDVACNVSTHKKKTFTKKNKLIIKIKKQYGLVGIIVLAPPLLSIPLGTFLAVRFYQKNKRIIIYLIISVIFWSIILSFLAYFFHLRFS